MNDRASQYAAWFAAHRIGHGDAVALVMDNRPDFIFIVSALSKLGGIAALINTNISGNALSHGINAAHPKMVLTGGEHLDRIDDPLYLLDGDGFAPIDAALFAQIQSGERKVS